jgi:hypothetical protein
MSASAVVVFAALQPNGIYNGWTAPEPIDPYAEAKSRVDHLLTLARYAREDIERKQTIHPGYECSFYDWTNCKDVDTAYAVEIETELAEAEEWLNVGLPEMLKKDGEE